MLPNLILGLSLAGLMHASIVTYSTPASGPALPDNNAAGVTFDLVITDNFQISGGNALTLDLFNWSHTWIGDLLITLEKVGETGPVVVFDRPWVPASGSAGTDCDFNPNAVYRFSSDAATVLPQGFCGDNVMVAAGTYRATLADDATASLLSSAFGGLSTQGVWRLTVADLANGDLQPAGWGYALNFNAVPEPSMVLPLAGALAAALAARRRAA